MRGAVAHYLGAAIVSGQMRAGDPFPSVRALSRALKINPNTAHKVVATLMAEGLLAVHPGIGTVVAVPPSRASDRAHLLKHEVEALAVEAKKLGLTLDEVTQAVADHWGVLEHAPAVARRRS